MEQTKVKGWAGIVQAYAEAAERRAERVAEPGDCPRCHGEGWVDAEVLHHIGGGYYNGELSERRCPDCAGAGREVPA